MTHKVVFTIFLGIVSLANVWAGEANLAIDHLAVENEPCWMSAPAAGGYIGQVGVASGNWSGFGMKPETRAYSRAVAALQIYLGVDDAQALKLENGQESVETGGHTVYFVDHIKKDGQMYAYARLDSKPATVAQCPRMVCKPQQCEPQWMCENESKDLALIGTSYTASTRAKQYAMVVKNAIEQADLIAGVNVAAYDRLIQRYAGARHSISHDRQGDMRLRGKAQARFLTTNYCEMGSSLFGRVTTPDIAQHIQASPEEWLANPSLNGVSGGVGIVEKPVASGLMSDRLALAIKRAIIDLALSEYAQVQDKTITIQRSNSGLYVARLVSQQTAVSLKAQVAGVHFAPTDHGAVVYAWVVKVD